VDVSDGRVDDRRFGWTTDLGEVGKQGREIQETAVESERGVTLWTSGDLARRESRRRESFVDTFGRVARGLSTSCSGKPDGVMRE